MKITINFGLEQLLGVFKAHLPEGTVVKQISKDGAPLEFAVETGGEHRAKVLRYLSKSEQFTRTEQQSLPGTAAPKPDKPKDEKPKAAESKK